jgi:hypothetical protein
MAGKPIPIDKDDFEELCGLQCTLAEIAHFFRVSEKTINRFCKRTYRTNFLGAFADLRQAGFISLRRTMWQCATGGNDVMLIWLSKNHLGMKDIVNQQVTGADGRALIPLDAIRAIVGSGAADAANDNAFPDDPAHAPG